MNLARKRAFTALVIGLVAQTALADWVMLTRNEDMRLYADRGNIRRDGDIATVSQMADYTFAQWSGATVIMSVIYTMEVDCAGKRLRTLAATAFSEQLGRGREVVSEKAPAEEWNDIPTGGSAEQLWKLACGKR